MRLFALLNAAAIARALEDPAEFTGRAEIWAAELRYIGDHPLLGAGFGTFTDTKAQSPLHNYVSGSWVDAVSHGHNGYLQVLVTIGGIGFVLAMLALVAAPARRLLVPGPAGGRLQADAVRLFSSLPCCTISWKSDFLEGDGVTWVRHASGDRGSERHGQENRNLNETLSRNAQE